MPASIRFKACIVLALVLVTFTTNAQQFYRIKADYSIKEKRASGESALTVGKVYYDKVIDQIVYLNSFPEKNTIIAKDTLMYRVLPQKPVDKGKNPIPIKFTVFYLSLNNQLSDFGLNNTMYKLSEVTKDGELVIKTWLPQGPAAKVSGKVLTSTRKNQLYGVILYSPNGEIIAKQFFSDYKLVNGLSFPGEIIQITYKDAKENYQVTTFRNIQVNDFKDDYIYRMSIPE